jgi:hypothetical protein
LNEESRLRSKLQTYPPAQIRMLQQVFGWLDEEYDKIPVEREILADAELPGTIMRATKGYVEDVGAAIALAAVLPQAAGRVYNVGEPDAPTELDWARAIAGTMHWTGSFQLRSDASLPPFLRAPGNTDQHWITDTSRLRAELGFHESVSREEAIRRTVEWQMANAPTGFTPHQFDYAAEDAAASVADGSL